MFTNMSVRDSNTAKNTLLIGQNEVRPTLNFNIFHLVRVIFELQAHQTVSTQTFSADEVCTRLLPIEIQESHDHLLTGLTCVIINIE